MGLILLVKHSCFLGTITSLCGLPIHLSCGILPNSVLKKLDLTFDLVSNFSLLPTVHVWDLEIDFGQVLVVSTIVWESSTTILEFCLLALALICSSSSKEELHALCLIFDFLNFHAPHRKPFVCTPCLSWWDFCMWHWRKGVFVYTHRNVLLTPPNS